MEERKHSATNLPGGRNQLPKQLAAAPARVGATEVGALT